MTRTTKIQFVGPIAVGTAYDLALRALLVAADQAFKYEAAARFTDWTSDAAWPGSKPSHTDISSGMGRGLPAHISAFGRTDGEGMTFESYFGEDGDECVNVQRDGWRDPNVTVTFDTSYGYPGGPFPLHVKAAILITSALPPGIELVIHDEVENEWFALDDVEDGDALISDMRGDALGWLAGDVLESRLT